MAQTADKLDVAAARRRFSSLQHGFAFFDAPGGSQVPDEVGEAIARTLREASANLGAVYQTSHRVGRILELAYDRDLVVRHVELLDNTTLDYDDLASKLGPRTRVVATS